ncbi:DHA2 family efflux MFS transporter permease subunit [Stenotrophomonas maltophilia]|uniref:MFS transporter n=1 Tax=Stenotrophomonas maltophilia TaxID=40324 RepID=UPI0015DE91A6|nr:MFS transporter [Stenotrophomonas maltophilia]ELN2584860.1 MFS transporter [Stenotrophomonas maltophilia]ELN2587562.1 MFS transporter [Stenotrophomonas maltophilia]ELN2592875.1 MFS transporter [Stenotrophomonas maltophilia]ELN2595727.1 MFS transporter [Stenotrophomonas maltophilia]MBA0298630.1 DHA2 family efflux MFS transporter permease subunit [Stenotrophomonas maltophilia]
MRRFQRPALVLAAYLGTFLASLDISIVNVALPTLQQALNTDMAGLQWVINAYAIALSALMLSAGPLGDRYGHRRMWLLSVATFTLGSLLCACAGNLATLVAGRAVQGIAGALLIPAAMPILSHAFPDARQRARAIGGWSAFSALALVLGPLLGGVLVQRVGWPSIFLINLPLGLLALALGAWGIPERRHPQHAALDPAGQLLSVVALGALSYGLIAIGAHGLLAPVTLLALGVAAAGLILFGIVERRVARPLLPLDLFADRRFGMFNLASFVLGFTAYASLFFLSLFFQQAQGHNVALAGSQLAPQFLLMGAVSLLFGRLVAHLGLHAALVLGYALAGAALCAMATFEPATSHACSSAVLVLLGIGMGLAVPATGMAVMASAPVERAGIASATMNALRQAGMSLGIALLGSLMGQRAVQQFAASAQAAGQRELAAQARELILQPGSMHATPQMLTWYRSAMASGFGWAMAVAGALALLAALGLYRQRAPA